MTYEFDVIGSNDKYLQGFNQILAQKVPSFDI